MCPPEVKCPIVERKNVSHPTVWRHLPEWTLMPYERMTLERTWPGTGPGFYLHTTSEHISKVKNQNQLSRRGSYTMRALQQLLTLSRGATGQSPVLPINFWEDGGNQHAGIKKSHTYPLNQNYRSGRSGICEQKIPHIPES